jgi:MarR family transcriptional regulator, lower aerobic nicotinate degradation pathway regulator
MDSIYPRLKLQYVACTLLIVMPSFDFTHAPGHLIRRAHQKSIALFSDEMAAFDVTAVQFAILQTLMDAPGSDQVTVAQNVALDAATSGSVIGRLEARGWLRRESDAQDKRRKLLWLTPEGKKAGTKMQQHARNVQAKLLAPLNADEKLQLVALLQKISLGDETR